MTFSDHSHSDSIGLAELGPDLGVLLASLVLPRYFHKFQGSPNVQQLSKTLSEQFMPDKSGKGVEDEILFNEMLMFFDPPQKGRVLELLDQLSKDERRFFINTLALWAAKYQKERKGAKTPDGKDAGGSSFMEPLTSDNPAIKFLTNIANGASGQTIEDMIDELRHCGMIQKSLKEKLLLKWKEYQEKAGKPTEVLLVEIINDLLVPDKQEKTVVGPLGYLFACILGQRTRVRLIGTSSKPKASPSKTTGHRGAQTKE